ncbi:hypothetical protein VTK26DRAFT_5547 [Humicola hyalothermophila]
MESEDKTLAEVREGNPPTPAKSEEPKAPVETNVASGDGEVNANDRADGNKKPAKDKCCKAHAKAKQKTKKQKRTAPAAESGSDSGSDDDGDTTSSSSASDGSASESEGSNNKRLARKRQDVQKSKKKSRGKKQIRGARTQQDSSGSDSDSDSSDTGDADSSDNEGDQPTLAELAKQIQQLLILQQQQQQQQQQLQQGGGGSYQYPPGGHQYHTSLGGSIPPPIYDTGVRTNPLRPRRGGHPTAGRGNLTLGGLDPNLLVDGKQQQQKDKKKRQKATKLDYKRVDQVWDNSIHNYKLQDTAEGTVDAQYDEFIFHVRRTFDWEGKYKATIVDIKSKLLRECLQDVMGNIRGVSLVEDTPKLDPNMLFLYLEDLRKHMRELKKTKASKGDKHERKKEQKRIETKRQHLKVLIKYIDKDYAEIKNSLYPMLENGLITFDLLWALWKPNTLAYTTTYGSHDEPRVFKVEVAEKDYSIMKGEYYYIEGKYFEYDGKQFGYGSMSEEIGNFRGARKITSLGCYPLKYHKNEAQLRRELVERGKKFVSLSGVHYKSHQGMAYYKKKKSLVKVNINGRIMVDPSIHRRINPNYPISLVRPKDHDVLSDEEDSDDEPGCCECGSEGEGSGGGGGEGGAGEKVEYVTKVFRDQKGKVQLIRMPKEDDEAGGKEKLDRIPSKDDKEAGEASTAEGNGEEDKEAAKKIPEFSDEEYLIASPVVLGFAFAEKLWLELTVSGVKDIQWNETAYDSLVLEPKTKDIVKALVESHKYHAAESIDDVIQGKGKGLVAVLHGPPGTGKTLTAEGISELLKCPLYMVSAGELGTDSRYLENELQRILDICHAWGAILLLDEADVFLEKRNMHDIHRNALVSIFLRQLEYFQGILFLTTNRVETFDDAFQSRIHIALRYDSLDHRAKKAIFKIFIERVRVLEKIDLMPFTEEDYNVLARHELNGRQIKNTVRTAQALAVNKGEPLSMSHIRQVLEVQINFERDLRGGTGYQDAMRSYF